jgi:transcriptional regulator GlxA family with amidase domain
MSDRPSRSRVPVYVVLPPRTLLLDVAGPLDVLRRANMVQDRVRFDVRYVGAAKSVVSSIGLELAGIDPLPRAGELPANAMVVIAGSVDEIMPAVREPAGRKPAPRRRDDDDDDAADEEAIVEWLRSSIRPDHLLVSICSGALLAARAGLLDGYMCTTHYVIWPRSRRTRACWRTGSTSKTASA